MRRRNREVNIFNMSLLDILCGTLGAFCFLMLALLPDHLKAKQLQEQIDRMGTPAGMNAEARAKKAEQDAEQAKRRADEAEQKAKKARALQSLAYFQVLWDGPQDVDLWVKMPDKKWVMPKKAELPKEQLYAESGDVKKGPAQEQAWITDVWYTGDVYELHAKLHSSNGVSGPVRITGHVAVRIPTGETTNSMSLYELPGELQREGELVMLGTLTFPANSNYEVTVGPRKPVPPPPKPGAPPSSYAPRP